MNKSIKKTLILVIILISLNVIFGVKVFASEGDLTVSGDNYFETKLDNGNWFSYFKGYLEPDTSVQLKVEYEQNGQKVDITDLCTWESDNTSVATVEKGCITAKENGYANINMIYKEHNREILVLIGEEEKNGWYFETDKSSITIDEGEEIDISIISSFKGIDVALYREVTDYWKVDWEIKDESIANCKKVTGIVTNRGTGVAGKATIKGLKCGTTTLVGRVNMGDRMLLEGTSNEFEINVTVCSKDGNPKLISPIETIDEDTSKGIKETDLIVGGIGIVIGMLIMGVIVLIIKKIKS